jgi:hypothetical protein
MTFIGDLENDDLWKWIVNNVGRGNFNWGYSRDKDQAIYEFSNKVDYKAVILKFG